MKKIALISLLLLTPYLLQAQSAPIPLWPKGAVPNHIETGEKEIKTDDKDVKYKLVQVPDMVAFLPDEKQSTGQAVIICPGGGYTYLAYDWEGTTPAKWLASKGVAAFVLKYRLPNSKSNVKPYLSPLLDAQRAIRMVRANATKWRINPNKVGIMGFSAGGHLASTSITHFDDGDKLSKDSIERYSSRPDFGILLYPVISMTKPIMHQGSRDNLISPNPDSSIARYYSSELNVTANTPPTFIVHSMNDLKVPVENSILFFLAMKEKGVSGELHVFPQGGHGFGMGNAKSRNDIWPQLCWQWLTGLSESKK